MSSSVDEAMQRFVELANAATAAWNASTLAAVEAACASTSRVADTMASSMQAAASVGCMATAMSEAVQGPAKQLQEAVAERFGAIATVPDCSYWSLDDFTKTLAKDASESVDQAFAVLVAVAKAHGTWYEAPSAALRRADAQLLATQKALEALGAAETLDESDERWAHAIAARGAWRYSHELWHRVGKDATPLAPLWETPPRIAQFKRVQQRATWLLVTFARELIHQIVRQRLRARLVEERLQLDIVTVQIA